ncbi:halocyanin domain-containing protein [Halosegnis longus]|uniref:Halocyanin domain-containing protein n=1 Tax=Halosegnis longus TaxID=2216012 RepID=A0AAJ4R8A8_9EURY|nr:MULTISPECIES: halocyanin domain-containing protein [Halobacteriales]RNJ26134.1 halocyanin domain-containing protein [Salella cibi]
MDESTLTRRRLLGTLGAAGAVGIAGCSSGGNGGGSTGGPEERVSTFLSSGRPARGYDEIIDMTGQDEVVVEVGAGGNGLAFAPAAVRISTETTVSWQWTGRGGRHNVVAASDSDFDFQSGSPKLEADPFERSFDDAGVGLYYCGPHRSLGMEGALIVE